jgi:hypothetical protein
MKPAKKQSWQPKQTLCHDIYTQIESIVLSKYVNGTIQPLLSGHGIPTKVPPVIYLL